MHIKNKVKGSWWQRFAVRFFTVLFTILTYWLLGFLLEDIEAIPGPDFATIEKHYLNDDLVKKQADLHKEILDLSNQIINQKEKQKNLADSSKSLQETMKQLLELQKISMQKDVKMSEEKQTNFTATLNTFLDNQKNYQQLSETISERLAKKQQLINEKDEGAEQLEKQRQPARKKYEQQLEKHRLNLAFYQLAILLPLLLVAGYLFAKKRTSIYFPFTLALGLAVLTKAAMVIHEYFPSEYLKYILTTVLLLVVGILLMRFIQAAAFPKIQWLLDQYREGYEHFLCPNCQYPIRTGPRRFLFWTRRAVNSITAPANADAQDEVYVCPSCGNSLFEECSNCHKIRHTLLPNCMHCGALKSIEPPN